MGKTNFLFADFSQHTFTQTHYIVKAEINEAGNDFNIANFIYRTYGEDYIHNDSVDDSLNERSAKIIGFWMTLCYLKTISATGGEISQEYCNRNLQIIRFFAITRTKRLPFR